MEGVSVRNRFFADDAVNALWGGFLALCMVLVSEQLVRALLFRRRAPLCMRHISRREIYDRLFHMRDLRSLLSGVEQPRPLASARGPAPSVCYERLFLPLLARVTVLAIDLAFLYISGTHNVVVNDPARIPVHVGFVATHAASRSCLDFVGNIRASKLQGSALWCVSDSRDNQTWNPGTNITVKLYVDRNVGDVRYTISNDNLTRPAKEDKIEVSAEYTSFDRVRSILPVFDSLPPTARGTGEELTSEFVPKTKLMNDILTRAAARAQKDILWPFGKTFASTLPGQLTHHAVISGGEDPDTFFNALLAVLRKEIGLIAGGQPPVVLLQNGIYGELGGAGVAVLDANRVDNSLVLAAALFLFLITVVIRVARSHSPGTMGYRAVVEAVGGDCIASPTGQAPSDTAVKLKSDARPTTEDVQISDDFEVDDFLPDVQSFWQG